MRRAAVSVSLSAQVSAVAGDDVGIEDCGSVEVAAKENPPEQWAFAVCEEIRG